MAFLELSGKEQGCFQWRKCTSFLIIGNVVGCFGNTNSMRQSLSWELMVRQRVKIFPRFCQIRSPLPYLKNPVTWSLTLIILIPSTPTPIPIYLIIFNVIPLYTQVSRLKSCTQFSMRATFFSHLIFLDFFSLVIFGEENKPRNSCCFIRPPFLRSWQCLSRSTKFLSFCVTLNKFSCSQWPAYH